MVSFEGDITGKPAMEGNAMISTVSVRRFIGVRPGQRCEWAMNKADLSDQYWSDSELGQRAGEGRRGAAGAACGASRR